MTTNTRFAVGETVAQYRIIEVLNKGKYSRYRVACERCGHVREINQGVADPVRRERWQTNGVERLLAELDDW